MFFKIVQKFFAQGEAAAGDGDLGFPGGGDRLGGGADGCV
jgi:hypothetical protein